MSKISLENCRLYVIVDRAAIGGRDPVAVAEAAIRGGADVIQWRDKQSNDRDFLAVAGALRDLTLRSGTLFIVNDRVDTAILSEADGVHLGHEDFPVEQVRSMVGQSLLIGRSTHSLSEARQAESEGAGYIGVGPVCSTPQNPDYPVVGVDLVQQVRQTVRIPWVAIGGIDLQTLPLVLSAGATRVAVVRAVSGASDPEQSAHDLKVRITASST